MKPYNQEESKKVQVRNMFNNIAPTYDRLNHILSVNIDRLWRRRVVRLVQRMRPQSVLDVATGTGDLAIAMARKIDECRFLGVDLSEQMLAVAREKVAARGLGERIALAVGDAEHLDVSDSSVDVVTVAFGVRNFENLELGLREMHRTIKDGGHIVVLEFSTPQGCIFGAFYRWYSHKVLPFIGRHTITSPRRSTSFPLPSDLWRCCARQDLRIVGREARALALHKFIQQNDEKIFSGDRARYRRGDCSNFV